MDDDPMTEREIDILAHISRKSLVSQRELSKALDMSLGLINQTLRKFVRSGHLQVIQLNKRKVQYHLTTEGCHETAKKAHRFTTETIKNYRTIESRLTNLLQKLYASGYDYFSIEGDGELRDLMESVFRQSLEEAPVILGKNHLHQPRAIVLNITSEPMDGGFGGDVVDVLDKITKIT